MGREGNAASERTFKTMNLKKDSIREGWLQTAEDPNIFLNPYETFQLQEQKYFTVRIETRDSIKVDVS